MTNEEASEVMKVVRFGVDGAALAGAKSASEMLREEAEKLPIYTFCQELDDLLGGGVAVGEITELCGCPGIGKTQMCIQLCASTQIPVPFGGLDGAAVYVDTEGSFTAERAADIAEATAKRVLLNAFTRALRDQFPPARKAGLMALCSTVDFYEPGEAATRESSGETKRLEQRHARLARLLREAEAALAQSLARERRRAEQHAAEQAREKTADVVAFFERS